MENKTSNDHETVTLQQGALMGSGFQGGRFVDAGSKDGIQITLGCITPEASDLLDTIMVEWEKHYTGMKESNPKHEPSYYGFAYWLVRWSGLVQPSHCP